MTPSRKTSAILTALSLLALILLVPVALALSPQGLKLACHWLSRLQPDIQLVYESGHLLEGRLAMMSMNSDALSVNVEGVSWKLARDCLWSSKLCFDVFEVDRALVKLQTDKNSDGSDARATIFPFEIIAENAQINRLIIHQIDGTEFEVSAINFAGQAYEKTVNLTRFSASYSSAQLSAQGQIKLSAELQLALALQLRYTRSEDDYYSANASIEGSLDELEIVGALTHPEKIEVRGWLRPRDLATSLIMSHVGTIPAVGSDWVLQDPTLQINGAWPALDFTFQSDLGSKQLGSSAVTIAARTSESTLEVSSFELSSQYVNWIGQGHIDYTPDLTGRFNTDLSLICPPETGPRLVCALDGTVDITGSLRDSILAISLDGDLQGSINQTMARLTTTLKGTSEGELQLGATELRVAENILRLTGNVGQNSDLIGNLDLVNLGQFLPGVTGSGRGNWRISGPISNPVASADFNLNSLSGKNLGLHELSLTAGWSGLTDRGWIDLASSGGNWGDAVLTHARSRCEFEVANVDAGRVSCVDVYFNIASDAEPWQLSEPLKMSWESVTADATVDPFAYFQ
jgi:autotransporter translocation and assembly factor TamB